MDLKAKACGQKIRFEATERFEVKERLAPSLSERQLIGRLQAHLGFHSLWGEHLTVVD